ncbi:hypothetical protein FKM82_004967 [Ascaphus truei]
MACQDHTSCLNLKYMLVQYFLISDIATRNMKKPGLSILVLRCHGDETIVQCIDSCSSNTSAHATLLTLCSFGSHSLRNKLRVKRWLQVFFLTLIQATQNGSLL